MVHASIGLGGIYSGRWLTKLIACGDVIKFRDPHENEDRGYPLFGKLGTPASSAVMCAQILASLYRTYSMKVKKKQEQGQLERIAIVATVAAVMAMLY